MTLFRPDPTFYPSPRMAMDAPPEKVGYVATLNYGGAPKPDALAVVDLDPASKGYGEIIHRLEMPYIGDELHHYGWNCCSSALCPAAPHPHQERRYLIVPGLRSSRIYIIDTKPDPARPTISKIIEPEELMEMSGYSRPHTVHCGPDAIYVSALASANGKGSGGIFMMDHFNFNVLGPWEEDRGAQDLSYDFWWHFTHDVMITSEWGKPAQFENGLILDDLINSRYGKNLHFWDLRRRKNVQTVSFGNDYQLVFEVRPAHEPNKTYGFVCVVLGLKDLSSSIWMWHRESSGSWGITKVIDIPAEPADAKLLPPPLQGFGAVPPLVTDIDLSLDDRFLYVSCWGTGELLQYDVSDPFHPRQTGSIKLGGIVRRMAHPKSGPLLGGPQMVEISRDGRRVYFTNSLYGIVDDQFYPDKMSGWMAKVDVDPNGGIALDGNFFVDFGETRAHQVRLEGGDASTDTFCYPS
ncbi:selenium-binding family protein [Geomonas sp. RF6]|uniref:selenium-binding family protein n=1 Tax=Geomonas sp. RF6 TaxID=2897342 RepID=UPI001E5FA14C|nr:selenium-binding family protein [Geomonas sp. RF6]UFS71450.1 selenium-binding family protein [Geomonas sp. RF6]